MKPTERKLDDTTRKAIAERAKRYAATPGVWSMDGPVVDSFTDGATWALEIAMDAIKYPKAIAALSVIFPREDSK